GTYTTLDIFRIPIDISNRGEISTDGGYSPGGYIFTPSAPDKSTLNVGLDQGGTVSNALPIGGSGNTQTSGVAGDTSDQFTFTRIANTDTPFPTPPGSHFSGFGTFPSVDAKGEVAFLSFDANSHDQAIFVGDGDFFHFVVDLSTALPGNPGPI